MLNRMNFSNSWNHSSSTSTEMYFCDESVSGSCEKLVRSLGLQGCMLIFMGLAIVLTMSGNLLVIVAISHFRQLHTSTNGLILSLALCDFLLGVLVMPCSAMRSVQGCWFLGDLACKLHTSMDIMLSTCSIFHLSFISVERYVAVCTPLLYQSVMNSDTTLIMVATSWLVPTVFGFGMIFSELNLKGSEDFYEAHVFCHGGCPVFFSQASATFASVLAFFIPGLIMFGIYLKIYKVARRQARSIEQQTQQLKVEDDNRSRVSRQRERKGTVILAIVVGVFFTCWTPFFLCTITDPFIGYSIPPTLVDALVWFGYMNSSFNPLIYAFFYSWFRKALKIIVSGKIFQRDSWRIRLYSE